MKTKYCLESRPIEDRIFEAISNTIVEQGKIFGTPLVNDIEVQKWFVNGLWDALTIVCEVCDYDVDSDPEGILKHPYEIYKKVNCL